MITLRELLRDDPLYRKWFMQVPHLTIPGLQPPWRVFLQAEERGKWSRLDFPSYPEAYNWLRERLRDNFDACIHSKRQSFKPPVVRFKNKKLWWPCPDAHSWCVYCRRPTVFRLYNKHPALPTVDPTQRRCKICGARKAGMKQYHTPLVWPLGAN